MREATTFRPMAPKLSPVTKDEVSRVMRSLGKRGGAKRARKLSKKRIREIARKGALATNKKRWGHKKKPLDR